MAGELGFQFAKNVKVVRGQTKPETAITKTTATFPATTFVDVSGYEAVDVLVHLGTLANALTIKLKQNSVSTGGTLDTISTANCVHSAAANDDGECVLFHLKPESLAADHHFIACQILGAGSTADYADVVFLLHGARHKPVTQATGTLPSASQHTHAG